MNTSFLNSKYLDPGYLFDHSAPTVVQGIHVLFSPGLWNFLRGVVLFLTFFFITLIAYCVVRMFEIRKKEHAHLHHEIHEYAMHQAEKEKKFREGQGVSSNPRWIQVLEYLASANSNDWKLAIIEADSMLDGLVTDMGFKGESLGEKLKNANRDTFRSLTDAWEVHTIRNRIAHEGSNFDVSLHEARRVIALYEGIFREFGYI